MFMGSLRRSHLLAGWATALLLVAGQPERAGAQDAAASETWITAWATAQQLIRPAAPAGGRGRGQAPAAAPRGGGAARGEGTGAPPPARRFPQALPTVANQTVRMVARSSVGGRMLRVRLANAFGAAPVVIGAAHVAPSTGGARVNPAAGRTLTFAGLPSVTLLPGTVVVSDPVALAVDALQDVAVSLYLPGDTGPPTSHLFGLRTTYVSADGNHVTSAEFEAARTTESYYWLSAIDVLGPADSGTLVAFGDSFTDGDRSTVDGHHTWPAELAVRLQARRGGPRVGIANSGIAGNFLLQDGGLGPSALARFERDVLAHPGVRWVVLLEGINDIGTLARPPAEGRAPVTEDALIAVLSQLATRARMHGIRVFAGTLPPFGGASNYSDAGDRVRQAVNQWIRSTDVFDAVIDFDAALRDNGAPQRIKSGLHADDQFHPNDAGYRLMAETIDLSLFAPPRARR